MDHRRFYVIGHATGEHGPFSLAGLREAREKNEIDATDQVRTSLGTMLGTVDHVLAQGSSAHVVPSRGRPLSLPRSKSALPVTLALLTMCAIAAGVLYANSERQVGVMVEAPPAPPASIPPQDPRVAPPVAKRALPAAPVAPAPTPAPSQPQAGGFVTMGAEQAVCDGPSVHIEPGRSGGAVITAWTGLKQYARWKATFTQGGRHEIAMVYACPPADAGSQFRITVGPRSMTGRTTATASSDDFRSTVVGFVHVNSPSTLDITVEMTIKQGAALMDLRRISFTPK